jgi:hypothetical protein
MLQTHHKSVNQRFFLKENEYGDMEVRYIHIMHIEIQQNVCSNTMDQQKEEMDTEIDELWKLMMKKFIWRYHGMKNKINYKL